MADLCLDFEIHDAVQWSNLLDQLCAFKMTTALGHVLGQLSGMPSLWSIASLEKSWRRLLALADADTPATTAPATMPACRATLACLVRSAVRQSRPVVTPVA